MPFLEQAVHDVKSKHRRDRFLEVSAQQRPHVADIGPQNASGCSRVKRDSTPRLAPRDRSSSRPSCCSRSPGPGCRPPWPRRVAACSPHERCSRYRARHHRAPRRRISSRRPARQPSGTPIFFNFANRGSSRRSRASDPMADRRRDAAGDETAATIHRNAAGRPQRRDPLP